MCFTAVSCSACLFKGIAKFACRSLCIVPLAKTRNCRRPSGDRAPSGIANGSPCMLQPPSCCLSTIRWLAHNTVTDGKWICSCRAGSASGKPQGCRCFLDCKVEAAAPKCTCFPLAGSALSKGCPTVGPETGLPRVHL